jgi:hypothetical protein
MANIQREKLREYRLLAERVGLKPYAESPELALTRKDALKALSLLRDANFPVLGGDVYTRVGDDIRVAYANWHADPLPSEDRDTYVRRSIETSENYIQKYPERVGETPLFVLVAAEPNSTFSQEGDRK